MGELDVVPADLREAAVSMTGTAQSVGDWSLTGSIADAQLGGKPDAFGGVQLGNGFPASAQAEGLLIGLGADLAEATELTGNNCYALSSALHVVADLYESTDLEEAVAFAFVEPGHTGPSNLPSHIDRHEVLFNEEATEPGPSIGAAWESATRPPAWSGPMGPDNYPTGYNYPAGPSVEADAPPPADNHHSDAQLDPYPDGQRPPAGPDEMLEWQMWDVEEYQRIEEGQLAETLPSDLLEDMGVTAPEPPPR